MADGFRRVVAGRTDLADVVIQRATSHRCINHGDQPAVLAAVLVDAA